ncbi:hypothetical protein SLS57_009521 [Botryosphaeria dothidea]
MDFKEIESLPQTSRKADVSLDVVLDVGSSDELGGLKLAPDGHTILVPQPTADPTDPLNWSWGKKHAMLAVISFTAFLGDFGSAAGVPLIILQGKEWDMTPSHVNEAGNLNVLMLAIGSLIWLILSSWWGRAPVMFWSTFLGALCTLACALTTSFDTFYAFRALMGLTLTSYQVTGLACIKDMFYLHEHARKINIWAASFVLSPYLGPCLANFMIDGLHKWRPVMWMVLGVIGLDLIVILLVADETYYDRSVPSAQLPPRHSAYYHRLLRILGIWQIKHHRGYLMPFSVCVRRFLYTMMKPIVLPAMLYYCMSFMWAVGINITSTLLLETPVEAGGYGFSSKGVGFLYFTPMVAVGLGEAFGHWFNDFVANWHIRRHHGRFAPESRLWTCYLAVIFMVPGLAVVGCTLNEHLHYVGIIMGWGLYIFGVMLATVAITAYSLDSFPKASPEIAGLINFSRTIGGFAVGYFQAPWGERVGYNVSFGIQAIVVAVAVCIIVVLHRWGAPLRVKGLTIGQPLQLEKI